MAGLILYFDQNIVMSPSPNGKSGPRSRPLRRTRIAYDLTVLTFRLVNCGASLPRLSEWSFLHFHPMISSLDESMGYPCDSQTRLPGGNTQSPRST